MPDVQAPQPRRTIPNSQPLEAKQTISEIARLLGRNRSTVRRGQIPNRRPISERPSRIEDRKQVGHWEGDTLIGSAHKRAIVTLVERKSGFALLAKVSNKTADLVGRAIEKNSSLLAHG